jgi:hypothetical protein
MTQKVTDKNIKNRKDAITQSKNNSLRPSVLAVNKPQQT